MKNFLLYIPFLAAVCGLNTSCSESRAIEAVSETSIDQRVVKTYDGVEGFSSLDVATGIRVLYQPSASGTVSIKADIDSGYAPYFKLSVEEEELCIRFEKEHGLDIKSKNPATVSIVGPAIGGIDVSSGASVKLMENMTFRGEVSLESSSGGAIDCQTVQCNGLDVDATSGSSISIATADCGHGTADVDASSGSSVDIAVLKGERFSFDGSSGAVMTLRGLFCSALAAEASSAVKMTLQGRCSGVATYDASSGAMIDAVDVMAESVVAEAASGARIDCLAAKKLTTEASSGGRINYKGDAVLTDKSASGVRRY